MKHIFIVNPAAGQRAGEKNFTDKEIKVNGQQRL